MAYHERYLIGIKKIHIVSALFFEEYTCFVKKYHSTFDFIELCTVNPRFSERQPSGKPHFSGHFTNKNFLIK